MRINEACSGDIVIVQMNTARMNPFFVAKVVETSATDLTVTDAHSIIFNEEGTSFNLMPLNPLGDPGEEFDINRSLIVTVAKADEQFEQALRKVTSGIEIASSMPQRPEATH